MDNQSTPDMSSGQASVPQGNTSSPDVVSGQGANNSGSQQTGSTQSKDWQSEFQRQADNAHRKITELAQANSQYQSEIAAIRQAQESQKQALLQAFGAGTQQQQQVDYFEQFAQNPNSIVELIAQKAEEIAAQKIQPIAEKITQSEVKEFLTHADSTKQVLRENLLKQYDPKIVDQVMDFTDVINPKIVQLNAQYHNADPSMKNQIQVQLIAELAREIQSRGGVEAIVEMKLGRFLLNNQESLMRSAAQIMQQKSFEMARSKGIPGFNNAGNGQASFGTGVRSESIYR